MGELVSKELSSEAAFLVFVFSLENHFLIMSAKPFFTYPSFVFSLQTIFDPSFVLSPQTIF
jgi:hypothetical protein